MSIFWPFWSFFGIATILMRKKTLASIAKDKKLYLYCRSGNRSGKAADILISLGYEDVTNLGSVESAAEYLKLNIIK